MDDDTKGGLLALLLIVIVGGLIALFAGVTDEGTAARILDAEGVTQIEYTGYDWAACGMDGWYRTGFTGLRNGKPVRGVVCSGLLFKASTVRYH
jgi:hypothetical protein